MRYARWSAAVAVGAGLALLPVAIDRGTPVLVWGFAGWGIVAVVGVYCGARLTAFHGRSGTGFLWLYGAGMAARMLALVATMGIARWGGTTAAWAYLAGLGAAWLATQGFEMVWFAARTRATR